MIVNLGSPVMPPPLIVKLTFGLMIDMSRLANSSAVSTRDGAFKFGVVRELGIAQDNRENHQQPTIYEDRPLAILSDSVAR